MKQIKYIVVGQGLAGTILAQTLLQEGNSVLIIDDLSLSKASRIAAGLYNPVVFKRLVKSWMADELIPAMDEFYKASEKLLNIKCYYKKQIVKIFSDENEKEFWLKKSEEVGNYLSKTIDVEFLKDIIDNSFGVSEVVNAGNLDTTTFLAAFRNYFKKNECLLEEKFDYNQLIITENVVTYKNIVAEKVIFCEGYKTIDNPYFSWLPAVRRGASGRAP